MRFANRLFTALAAFCLCASIAAADAPAYLFLIDQAPGMAPRREAALRTVSDLIRTGFHERIQPGETFAIWSCAQALHTNLPSYFDTNNAAQIAELAVAQIPKTSGPSNLKAALASVQPVNDLTAFILTDGRQLISGTPFDGEINQALTQNRERFARELKPFLITLISHDGRWVASAVHTNLGAAIVLPDRPAPDLLEKALRFARAERPKTNTVPLDLTPLQQADKPQTKTAEASVVTKAAELKKEPIRPKTIEPKITPAPPGRIADFKPVDKPVVSIPTQSVQNSAPPPVRPEPVIAKQEIPQETETIPKSISHSNDTVGVPPSVSLKPEVEAASPSPLAGTSQAIVPSLATDPPPGFPWGCLLSVFGLIGGCGWFVYNKLRPRPAPPGSMISQALPEPTPPPSKVIPKS